MDREPVTIPEVFRREMEQYGWGEGGDGDDRGKGGGRGCLWMAIPLLLLGLLFFSFDWIVTTYTEWLWFISLGYDQVWLKQWGSQLVSFALFFGISLVVLLLNWHLARRSARPPVALVQPSLLMRGINWLINGGALAVSYLLASAGASQWEEFLRYLYRVPYGTSDPIFNQDIGFYFFELPVYNFLRGWLMALLFLAGAGVAIVYALADVRQAQENPVAMLQRGGLRRHLALLGTLFLSLWALGYWFDRYGLLFSEQGVIFGAGYTDLNGNLLALQAQMVTMALVALAVASNIFRPSLRLPLLALLLWFASGLGLGALYPGFLQRYVVEPNELAREAPFIGYNIDFTRMAFGLDRIENRPFEVGETLDATLLESNQAVLQNVRIWDPRPLRQTYSQLQELRPYYEFLSVDVDRYEIDGTIRQVMLAARELNKADLGSPSWINQKLEFTHGYGIVMSPVDQVTRDGQPFFFIQDLPPTSRVPIEIERPEIYYGELTLDEVFVASGLEEFDYPSGDQNVYSSYEGTGGIPLDGLLRRAAFAFRLGEFNVLLSEYITPETRVMLHREIRERVQRITPFLLLDEDPYLVVAEGRLIWMLDAYTVSRDFPYSTPNANGSFNYIRNAAKITIDAYNGTVTYYLAAPEDPLVQSYSRAFPGLFKPMEEMPESLQRHIRYPEGLFLAQTEQYRTYHMQDVQVFYNKEDLWEIPVELYENEEQVPTQPYYVIFPLPDEEESEYLLIRPYAPRGKNNMIAWIAARNDPPHYGELIVYELPKQELVYGPSQIESRIDQEPAISQQITLWSQRGSRVIRGNLIVIPLGDNFLYVEPLYLQSENSALPELRRVILASGDQIVMRETLGDAVTALLGEGAAIDLEDDPPTEQEGETAPSPASGVEATLEELVISANGHFEAAEAAQREGDWTTYGNELEALREDLERMMELTEGRLPAEAPASQP